MAVVGSAQRSSRDEGRTNQLSERFGRRVGPTHRGVAAGILAAADGRTAVIVGLLTLIRSRGCDCPLDPRYRNHDAREPALIRAKSRRPF